MKIQRHILALIAAGSLGLGCPVWAAVAEWDEEPSASETPSEVAGASEESVPSLSAGPSEPIVREVLTFGLRFDTSFSAGSPAQQGFFIPSSRLSAYGVLSDWVSYRFSVGQTREFSTVLLPQLLPVEAFLNLSDFSREQGEADPMLSWKVGLFTPSFHPNWTKDLSDLDLPDYGESHKALFMARDIGTELSYEFSPRGMKLGIGAFNGNGIVSMNSNNSKAFTAFVQNSAMVGEFRLTLLASGYALFQSSRGSINYRSRMVGMVSLLTEWEPLNLSANLDFFGGTFEDSMRSLNPSGWAASVSVGIEPWMRVWGRVEILSNPPESATNPTQHFQIGPELLLGENFKLFAYYDYLNFELLGAENSFQVRLRLNL